MTYTERMWELIFMMLILKIPIVYLCVVVWWAIRAEPKPPEFAMLPARVEPSEPCPWRRPRRPVGGPSRPPSRRVVRARKARMQTA